ncbi:hypothetical protein ACW2AL_15210 [Providencia sp. PROV170]
MSEGEKKERQEATIVLASKLLKQGISLEIIMESTGLSYEVLVSLQ